jgi:thioesterase domain-containing protein/acyl carrier protein
LPDGNIAFLGRLDNQLKIRGFRIEPGEIETVLSQCTGVREAAVIAWVNNVDEKCLVAYVEANGNARLTSQSLRSYLKEKLPEYMIPTAFVLLDSLPLTSSGKLDRRALPEPDPDRREDLIGYVAPRTTVEQVLAEIWADVLGRERVSVHDNFFDLGGYSLMAIRLIAEVCKELQIELPLRQLFECPTIAEFAERVNSKLSRLGADRRASSRWQYLLELKPGSGRYPVFFLPGGTGGDEDFLVYARLTYFAGEKYTFYGLRARSADGKESGHSNVEEMAADYIREIRELQPEGPYFIAAECIGGIVAYEIARQLRLQGQDIGLLVLMDTMCPSTFVYIRYRLRRWGESYYGVRLRHHFEALKSLSGYARVFYLFTKSKALFRDRSRIVAEMRSIVGVVESEDPCRIQTVKENYAKTLTRYRPKTYEGDVCFLVNENRRSDRPVRRWQKHIKGKLQLKKVPGNHTTYIRLYVRIAGAALRECLDRASTPANEFQGRFADENCISKLRSCRYVGQRGGS